MSKSALPSLARGRHPWSRRRGCLMEVASVLAGERWSDHPRCAHPVVAAAARRVNDLTSEHELHRLAPLAPLVLGSADPDPGHATRLARFCLDWVGDIESRHRHALDCSALTAELLLEVAPPAVIEARHTTEARKLNRRLSPTLDTYARRAAPAVAVLVSEVIAETSTDSDTALRTFLEALLRFAREDRRLSGPALSGPALARPALARPALADPVGPSRLHRLLGGGRG